MKNKRFRSVFGIVMATVLLLSFAGCKGKSAEKTAAEESAVFVGKLKAGKPINLLVTRTRFARSPIGDGTHTALPNVHRKFGICLTANRPFRISWSK